MLRMEKPSIYLSKREKPTFVTLEKLSALGIMRSCDQILMEIKESSSYFILLFILPQTMLALLLITHLEILKTFVKNHLVSLE